MGSLCILRGRSGKDSGPEVAKIKLYFAASWLVNFANALLLPLKYDLKKRVLCERKEFRGSQLSIDTPGSIVLDPLALDKPFTQQNL